MSRPTVFSAAGLLTAYCTVRPRLLEAVVDSLAGQPQAQSYDTTGGSAEPWCWDHGRPVSRCHADDLFCSGEVVSSNDPTGNAAVSGDPASKHRAELERLEAEVIERVERLDTLRALYLPKTLPTGADRARLASRPDDGCYFCWEHAKVHTPPHLDKPTTVGGILNVARHCCSSCYFFIQRKAGRAPTAAEVRYFHGKDVRDGLPRGKWPKVSNAA